MKDFRMNRLVTVIALMLSGLLALAGPASAQPGYGEGGPAVGLSASTSNDTITATGTGFEAGEPVTATVYSTPRELGTKEADASGSVSFTFSVRDLAAGAHRIVLTAKSGSASAAFTVGPRAGGVAGSDSGGAVGSIDQGTGSDDGLAYTGSDLIVPLSIIGVLLLVGGGLAVLGTRRGRRRADRT